MHRGMRLGRCACIQSNCKFKSAHRINQLTKTVVWTADITMNTATSTPLARWRVRAIIKPDIASMEIRVIGKISSSSSSHVSETVNHHQVFTCKSCSSNVCCSSFHLYFIRGNNRGYECCEWVYIYVRWSSAANACSTIHSDLRPAAYCSSRGTAACDFENRQADGIQQARHARVALCTQVDVGPS